MTWHWWWHMWAQRAQWKEGRVDCTSLCLRLLGLGREGESAPTYCEDVGRWATPLGPPRRLRKPWPLLVTLFTPVLQERKLGQEVLVTCSRSHGHKLQSPGLANPHPQLILENSTVNPSQGFSSPSGPSLPLPPPGSHTPTSGSLFQVSSQS